MLTTDQYERWLHKKKENERKEDEIPAVNENDEYYFRDDHIK